MAYPAEPVPAMPQWEDTAAQSLWRAAQGGASSAAPPSLPPDWGRMFPG